jgi:hypothetical protein
MDGCYYSKISPVGVGSTDIFPGEILLAYLVTITVMCYKGELHWWTSQKSTTLDTKLSRDAEAPE